MFDQVRLDQVSQAIAANWLVFGAVLLLALLVAVWILRRRPTTRIRTETPDVLTPGAPPAQRNTALVDAPPAAAFAAQPITPPPATIGLGGLGEVVSSAAAEEVAQAAPSDEALQGSDDLSRIKGVGPKLVALLGSLGITRYDQIAAWSEADIARIDAKLGPFQGRIVRDDWVGQCRYLAAGDVAGFEGRFGKV